MPLKNTPLEYGAVAKIFHWLMAAGIIGMLALGLYMGDLPLSPEKLKLYALHKAIGITLLALVFARILWRANHMVPALPEHMKRIEKLGAHLSHFGLYGLMLFMPISGWLMSSAAGFPVSVFGLFTMPNLIEKNTEQLELLKEAHELAAYLLIALITAHALAALLHHFYHKDTVLLRMLPFTNFFRR